MKILGNPEVQFVGYKRTFSLQRGMITELVYEGPTKAVQAAEASLYPHVSDYDADYSDPPIGRLTIRTPDAGDGTKPKNGIISTTFELSGNATGKSIYEHPTSIALGTDTLNAVKNDVSNQTPDASSTIYLGGGSAKTMRDMLIKGQDTFLVGQFVFKITTIITTDAEVDIAYDHTSMVYSSAALIDETKPTALYVKAINKAYDTVKTEFYGGADPAGHIIGWLKNPPDISNIGGTRQAVTIQYWLDAWRSADGYTYGSII